MRERYIKALFASLDGKDGEGFEKKGSGKSR